MSRNTNARIAGATFLFYIIVGLMRAPTEGLSAVSTLLQCFSALVLAVTLYAITRVEDQDIARLGLVCRVTEGALGGSLIATTLAVHSVGSSVELMRSAAGWNVSITGTFFAVGSTAFCWLLLRGRMIPRVLAWLGVFASALLVVGLPLHLAGMLAMRNPMLIWLPMAAFEVPVALWFLIKGVAPVRQQPPATQDIKRS